MIDLHIHTSSCSDGNLSIEKVFAEADRRSIEFMSTTDHDSIDCQTRALELAAQYGIRYITGVELNVTFTHERITSGKGISLDFLGYGFDHTDRALNGKLAMIRDHREKRAREILRRLNVKFEAEGRTLFSDTDLDAIRKSADGALGRPHIADYLVEKEIVRDRNEAFDRYLVECNVPKYPLQPEEAAQLVHDAGGVIVIAHPADTWGTSLYRLSPDLTAQTKIIAEVMLDYLDGIECYHYRHDEKMREHYRKFAESHNLIFTGGSDCHQKPIQMGEADVPDEVAEQFDRDFKGEGGA